MAEEMRQYTARIPEEMWTGIEQNGRRTGRTAIAIIRSGIEKELGVEVPNVKLVLRNGAPCGEWKDATEDETELEVSGQMAELWGIQAKDELIATQGCSMLGAGIPERAILHMRPFKIGGPKSGDICSVLAVLEDGTTLGTVKTWEWSGKVATLRNGDGERLNLPDGVRELIAAARWTGHLMTY